MVSLRSSLRSIPGLLNRFRRGRSGAAAILLAAAIVPLVGLMGLAVDTGRTIALRARLSDAIDAAGLAAAQELDATVRAADMRAFFDANFRMDGVTLSGPHLVESEDGRRLEITATASIDATLMRVVGINDITVSARTVVQRKDRGIELALVMDNTGSMRSGGKIGAMKAAAQELIDRLFDRRDWVENLWVSVVPFTATVNVGSGNIAWLNDATLFDGSGTSWKGCVEARYRDGRDMNDDPPAEELWDAFFYPSADDNIWPGIDERNSAQNAGTGPNLGCGPAITPLTRNYSTITAAITEMQPWHRGGTMNHMGIAWGWRTISPLWQGLWTDVPSNLPLDYGDEDMSKVMIVLTDGENQFYNHNNPPDSHESDYTAYGRTSEQRIGSSRNNSNNELDDRTAELCNELKATDIIVYTITFRVSDSATLDLFEDCATSPGHYFNSPSNDELRATFRAIASQLSELRVAE